jgi:Uma2 family endonuclease
MAVVTISSTPIDAVPPGEHIPTADQRVVMYDVTWEAFESILAIRGERRPRVTYLKGTLELMSPSRSHEMLIRRFAAILDAYLSHLRVTYEGLGAWLLKNSKEEAGLEPDECYILHDVSKDKPDLALEVVWTSGGINKLEIYRRLGVAEVWFWIKGKVSIHVLTDAGYEIRPTSPSLPDFDFTLVAEMMTLPSLSAVNDALRERFVR